MLRISPGREQEFSYFQEWLATSAALDRIIAATEGGVDGGSPRRNVATDNALSRLIGSVIMTRDLRAPANPPQPLFHRPAEGGTPCGSTCT